ncbi:MAG TPA: hypothetical protein VH880_05980, partial [Anaeromyxobacteraceae bacterium]
MSTPAPIPSLHEGRPRDEPGLPRPARRAATRWRLYAAAAVAAVALAGLAAWRWSASPAKPGLRFDSAAVDRGRI